MTTDRRSTDPRLAAQATVLKSWGNTWRKANGKTQQDLGRAAGYGSDDSPKSAAVAISRIESGKTEPSGLYRANLLSTLGHTEAELKEATDRALSVTPKPNPVARFLGGPIYVENESRRQQIMAASARLSEEIELQMRASDRVYSRSREEFVLPFLRVASHIDWAPLLSNKVALASNFEKDSSSSEVAHLGKLTQVNVLRTLADSAAGMMAGAGAGVGAAAAVFASVSATATASTGTAIAALSGAASSSATLAWIGGGTLAAGGAGMAGGAAILTGVATIPALLALGGVLAWKGVRLRREAAEEAEQLDVAQQAHDELKLAFEQGRHWNDLQQSIIMRANYVGRGLFAHSAELERLADLNDGTPADLILWDTLKPDTQAALNAQLALAGLIVDIHSLPIWLGMSPAPTEETVPNQESARQCSNKWIDESLEFAPPLIEQIEQQFNI